MRFPGRLVVVTRGGIGPIENPKYEYDPLPDWFFGKLRSQRITNVMRPTIIMAIAKN